MKEDLIKILNFKLKQIKENIENLNLINKKIADENLELEYIEKAIENFKSEEHGFDIYKFSNIERETFNKLLMNLSNDVLEKFGTNSCNYDGLVYLINGINNNISLTLTQEQIDAINLFIDKLLEKEKEYQDRIAELNEDKQKLAVKDLDVLNDLENKYSLIIENIEDKKYVTEIDEIVDAINYSELSNERAFDVLCYLLKYNSEVYGLKCQEKVIIKDEEETKEIDLSMPFDLEEKESDKDNFEISFDNEATDNESIDKESELESDELEEEKKVKIDVNFDDEEKEVASNKDDDYNPILPFLEKDGYFETNDLPSIGEFNNQKIDVVLPNLNLDLDLPVEDDGEYEVVNIPLEEEINSNDLTDIADSKEESNSIEIDNNDASSVEIDAKEMINNHENNNGYNYTEVQINENPTEIDFNHNIESTVNSNLENNEVVNETELNSFLDECEISVDDEINKNLLLKGNIDNYKKIINKLSELNVYNNLKDYSDLLVQILLYSNETIIDEINEIIKNDLSLDNKDKDITTDIVFKTMPSIFINSENGSYNNFVNNVKFFKEHGIDLINLFDFSREIFVADNSFIVNNYEIVHNYDLTVNAYNAKYLLLLPNIGSRIDYYVEAIYKDNSEKGKDEIFDGIEMIKLYPDKLNTVNSETIKRLRFSSENGLKVFGTKEKALTGEITNLDVNIIKMSDYFLNSLLNNQFDIIDQREVNEYVNLINNNEYVEMNEDSLLEKLSGYKSGLRYFIGNINVSLNKVIRIYNILINNGIDKKKALLFAICYNLVITKTEYERLKLFINGLGGN